MSEELLIEKRPLFSRTLDMFLDKIRGIYHSYKFSTTISFPDNEFINNSLKLLKTRTTKSNSEDWNTLYVKFVTENTKKVARSIEAKFIVPGWGELRNELSFGVFKITKPNEKEVVIYGGPRLRGIEIKPNGNVEVFPLYSESMKELISLDEEISNFLTNKSRGIPDFDRLGYLYEIPVRIPKESGYLLEGHRCGTGAS